MEERVRQILTDLERVRENLLELSDDIWLHIDHNNSDALKRGVEFKLTYNDKLAAFNRLAAELSELVQGFTKVQLAEPRAISAAALHAGMSGRNNQQVVEHTPHSIYESFTWTRPAALTLEGQAYTGIPYWKSFYGVVCRHLSAKDPARFRALLDAPEFVTTYGNPAFAVDPKKLRTPLEIVDGIYAETHFSANAIRDNFIRLLTYFQIDPSEMVIYLRESEQVSAAS